MSWAEVELLLRDSPVVSAGDHPGLRSALRTAEKRGRLVRVLPGIYMPPGHVRRLPALASAAAAYDPDAVVVGRSALALLLGHVDLPSIDVATPRRRIGSVYVHFSMCRVAPEWVVQHGRIRVQHPAAAAVELAASDDGEAIDLVLCRRAATLEQLRAAADAHPGRAGNRRRLAVLLDSRDAPWSAAERLLHRLLREAGIGGWTSNYRVEVRGVVLYADIAFPKARWVLEVDGFETHSTRTAFVHDRRRQNLLMLAGWRVLRFSWIDLREEPRTVVAQILEAVGGRPQR